LASQSDLVLLLKEAGCPDRVIAHCAAVRDLAETYTKHTFINCDLVLEAAMLHDIGRGISHAIDHAQLGADFCREKGLSEDIARCIECHIGAGLTADECTLQNLLPRDCMPQTIEEKIVANSDNLVKGTQVISIGERMRLSWHLPRTARRRIFSLAMEMELLR
jgi:uncharacterized protein